MEDDGFWDLSTQVDGTGGFTSGLGSGSGGLASEADVVSGVDSWVLRGVFNSRAPQLGRSAPIQFDTLARPPTAGCFDCCDCLWSSTFVVDPFVAVSALGDTTS